MISSNVEEFKVSMDLPSHKNKMTSLKHVLKRGIEIKWKLFHRDDEKGTRNKSIRPLPQEANIWKSSFNDLLSSKYGIALFKAFLHREFCDENLEFWLAVEDYRRLHAKKLQCKAREIYNTFLAPQSEKEINLDSLIKTSIGSQLNNPTITLFDQAQRRIYGILEADAYNRFCDSQLYLELVYPERFTLQA